ncbi:MAG TPA: DUF1761 domain-containing protein [Actinomycetota bacterium]
MSFDLLGDADWLAVLLAAVAYFVIGAVWYAPPVFGRAWMAAGGLPDMRETGGGPGPAIYVVPLIGSALSAIALGMIAVATGTDTVGEGFVLGLVVGIGFAISIALVTATFESTKPKPMVWGAVNGGYHLVGNVVAAVVIAAMA